jgi:hypothetical protein
VVVSVKALVVVSLATYGLCATDDDAAVQMVFLGVTVWFLDAAVLLGYLNSVQSFGEYAVK